MLLKFANLYSDYNKIQDVEVNKYGEKESIFEYTCNSNYLNLWEVSKLAKNSIRVLLKIIETKFVFSQYLTLL